MIAQKLKTCAGFDGVEHQAYIYKNIEGKKYCKSCTFKLQPPKPLFKVKVTKKISDSAIGEDLYMRDQKFYLDVWHFHFYWQNEDGSYTLRKRPTCEVCNIVLSTEPNTMYFHHILEKRKFPELRHALENIAIVCPDCHSTYETMPDLVPSLKKRREELLTSLL